MTEKIMDGEQNGNHISDVQIKVNGRRESTGCYKASGGVDSVSGAGNFAGRRINGG